jgi:hypothetical protein
MASTYGVFEVGIFNHDWSSMRIESSLARKLIDMVNGRLGQATNRGDFGSVLVVKLFRARAKALVERSTILAG